jgi:hypothetical protein
MTTLHITEDANYLLVYLLNGSEAITRLAKSEQDAADLCLKAKLIHLVEDGERVALTPAGRHWAETKVALKRKYGTFTPTTTEG